MKKLLALFSIALLCSALLAQSPLQLYKRLATEGIVTSIDLYKNTLYVATNKGTVELYSIENFKKIGAIKLPPINDFLGDKIPPKIFQTHSIDGQSVLILSQESGGATLLSLYEGGKIRPLKTSSQTIARAYFASKDSVILGYLGNEIERLSLKNLATEWKIQPSEAVFSDLVLSGESAISTTEGGVVYVLDVKSGKITKTLQGANLDNVYMLAAARGVVLTAGRDKSCGVYQKSGSFKKLETDFLAYAVGISEDSSLGAVSFNEENNILLFKTESLAPIALLKGGDALPNRIIFVQNRLVIAGFDSNSVVVWKIDAIKKEAK